MRPVVWVAIISSAFSGLAHASGVDWKLYGNAVIIGSAGNAAEPTIESDVRFRTIADKAGF